MAQVGDADDCCAAARDAAAGRRDHRHPHAAHPHRRGPARRAAIREEHRTASACSSCPSTPRPSYALRLLGEGADGIGYLLKDRVADIDDFADAVRRVAAGGSALDPVVVARCSVARAPRDPLDDADRRASARCSS